MNLYLDLCFANMSKKKTVLEYVWRRLKNL